MNRIRVRKADGRRKMKGSRSKEREEGEGYGGPGGSTTDLFITKKVAS